MQPPRNTGKEGDEMFKPIKVIEVFLGGGKVGRLAYSSERRCLFEYDPQWIQEGFSISPFYLPLQSGVFTARNEPFNGMFGVFNDSLPDGCGQLLTDCCMPVTACHHSIT